MGGFPYVIVNDIENNRHSSTVDTRYKITKFLDLRRAFRITGIRGGRRKEIRRHVTPMVFYIRLAIVLLDWLKLQCVYTQGSRIELLFLNKTAEIGKTQRNPISPTFRNSRHQVTGMGFHHNQVLPSHRLEVPDRRIHFFIHYDARPIAAHSCFRIGIKDFEIRIEIPGGTTRTIESIPVASSRKILGEHRLPNVVVRPLHQGPI